MLILCHSVIVNSERPRHSSIRARQLVKGRVNIIQFAAQVYSIKYQSETHKSKMRPDTIVQTARAETISVLSLNNYAFRYSI